MEFRKMYRRVFWTLWSRARGGWFGRMALKHVLYHIGNKSPVQVQCRIQDAWGWCTGMTQRDGLGKDVGGGFRMRKRVHPCSIHVDVWQYQYNIVISL